MWQRFRSGWQRAARTATEEEKDFAEIVVDFQQYVEGECVYPAPLTCE